MEVDRERLIEVRLLVFVVVDASHEEFVDVVRLNRSTSVAELVSSEVVSNLESVPFVETVIATQL